MKEIYRNNKSFLLPFAIVILAATPVLILSDKGELHMFLNRFYSPFFDQFFRYATYLGDGITVTVIAAILLFKRLRYAFFVGFSNIGVSAVVQFLKRVVFSHSVRPSTLLGDSGQLHLVDKVHLYHYNSFPSGHTAAAFALFFSLTLIVKQDLLKGLFFLLALITAYSRVYLSQHFLIDTYFGALIGVAIVIVFYYLIIKSDKTWLDKSIITIFSKNEK